MVKKIVNWFQDNTISISKAKFKILERINQENIEKHKTYFIKTDYTGPKIYY